MSLRGNTILIAGDADEVKLAERFLRDAAELVSKGFDIGPNDVASSLRGLRADPDRSLTELLDETIIVTSRKRPILPKSHAQRNYVEAIRSHDLIFGIGPAGTGKTYLAMAMAASWLMQKKVKRIVMARPAVEAGEKLGFLPGDLAEKVNPYLRPLYDALHETCSNSKKSSSSASAAKSKSRHSPSCAGAHSMIHSSFWTRRRTRRASKCACF